ncbi:Fe-S cluster assembly protein IscX [Rickettsia endosymbiont of Nabis limbatus]|uniref:Fe-S cluster assembly protein IscX n=1 Tax=Rickettsia endosymbiont of Nabis limbatus TaxID=3066268 RepID=UPI003AF38FC1
MHWRDIEEIAEHLEDNYSDDYSSNMKLAVLKEMVTSLTDFEDHEVEVKGETLEEILEKWREIREEMEENE